jgi:hypothetical protein
VLVRTSVLIQYRTSGRDEATQSVDLLRLAQRRRQPVGGAVCELAIMLPMANLMTLTSTRA